MERKDKQTNPTLVTGGPLDRADRVVELNCLEQSLLGVDVHQAQTLVESCDILRLAGLAVERVPPEANWPGCILLIAISRAASCCKSVKQAVCDSGCWMLDARISSRVHLVPASCYRHASVERECCLGPSSPVPSRPRPNEYPAPAAFMTWQTANKSKVTSSHARDDKMRCESASTHTK